jgi:hypothetical protein
VFNKQYDIIMTVVKVNDNGFQNCDLKGVAQIVETKIVRTEFRWKQPLKPSGRN